MGRFDSIVYHFQNFVFQKPELTQKIETEAASMSQAKDVEEDSPVPSPQSIADQGADSPVPSPQNIADQVAETVVTGAIEQALDSEELKK
jgi:hypothetical protein